MPDKTSQIPSYGVREIGKIAQRNITIPNLVLGKIEEQFNKDLGGINKLTDIYNDSHLSNDDKLNILRAQIVLLDSALDLYMHEITKYGMIKIFSKEWKSTDKFKKFTVPIQFLQDIYNNKTKIDNIIVQLDRMINRLTFQQYAKINDQLELIGVDVDISKFEKMLYELSGKRNRIAHQSGRNNIQPDGTRKTENLTQDRVKALKEAVHNLQQTIHDAVKKK